MVVAVGLANDLAVAGDELIRETETGDVRLTGIAGPNMDDLEVWQAANRADAT
jgi:hypothetical protein